MGAYHHQKSGNRTDPSDARVRLEAMQDVVTETAIPVVLQMRMVVCGRLHHANNIGRVALCAIDLHLLTSSQLILTNCKSFKLHLHLLMA